MNRIIHPRSRGTVRALPQRSKDRREAMEPSPRFLEKRHTKTRSGNAPGIIHISFPYDSPYVLFILRMGIFAISARELSSSEKVTSSPVSSISM